MIVVQQTSGATVRKSNVQTIGASSDQRDRSTVADASRSADFASHLPRLEQVQVRAANLAYGLRCASEFSAWEQTLQWRWSYRTTLQPVSEFAELAAHNCRAWIAVAEDRGLGSGSSPVDWRALQGDARLLAWTLRHEPLVVHLGRLLGVPLEPVTLVPANEHERSDRTRLDFAICDPTGSEIGCGTVIWEGPFEPNRLTGHTANSEPNGLMKAVAIPFRLIAGELQLPLEDLHALECGDVVALATSAHAGTVWLEAPRQALTLVCRLESETLRVETVLSQSSSPGSPSMSAPPPESIPPQPNLEALPVTMKFEAGEIEIGVGELKTIAPGYTFSLGRTLADSPVVIRAGGRVIGRGEFVLVDQFIGVRVLELTEHGSE